ncbi:MAG TPA: sugar ABC transporter ATP-binding protein [Acetobacteraceae bacterium]|nr:sugar ABC transporter ATP-binding protein [Acetobacteraceae bacterium]
MRVGEVHALVGANGAGKSTLSRIISGHLQPDSGEIRIDERPVHFAGARDAIRSGVAMVMQETSLAPDLSILENIMLPRLGMRGAVGWRSAGARVKALLHDLGEDVGLEPGMLVRDLSIAQRQLVEIAKALALDSRILIFDEPTAALSPHESERLFDVIRELANRGRGVIFVSHRLEEIFSVTDRITVLREGQVVASGVATTSLSQTELVRLMVGRDVSDIYARHGMASGSASDEVLRVQSLAAPPQVRDVSFTVRRGEIVGIAGLVGAGRSETLETIFGLRRASAGSITFDGRPFSPRNPREAIHAGIGFVPSDRRGQGIVPDFSVRENLMLAHLGAHDGPGLGYNAQASAARKLLELLELPQRRLLDSNMLNFSGGMQQKVILARWLLLEPRLLLLDEPTRGVDIGTRSSIYALLRRVAAEGVACVVVSSDFEEVIGIASRVVVLSDGVSVTDIPSHLVDIERLTMFAAPRSSAERTHMVLGALASEFGGSAYWFDVAGSRLFCFDRVDGSAAPEPGFASGAFPEIAKTRIPHALTAMADGLVTEADGKLHSLLVPIHGRRGHRLGLVGLTLARSPSGFDANVVRRRVQNELDARSEAA